MTLKAVLFDMDGTLVDSETVWESAERHIVTQFGGTWTSADARVCWGQALPFTAARMIEHGVRLSVEETISRLIDYVVESHAHHVPWLPGATDLLSRLVSKGIPCGLVTMSPAILATGAASAAPNGVFHTVVTGDRVEQGKPHPEPYLTAAAELGIQPSDCVAIEDSLSGVTSALAAGMHVIAVQTDPHDAQKMRALGASIVSSLTWVNDAVLQQVSEGKPLDLG